MRQKGQNIQTVEQRTIQQSDTHAVLPTKGRNRIVTRKYRS